MQVIFKSAEKSKRKEPYYPLLGDAHGQLPEVPDPALISLRLRPPELSSGDSPQVPRPLLDISGGPAPPHGSVAGQLLQEPYRCRRARLLGGKELCETEEARLKHGTRPGARTPRSPTPRGTASGTAAPFQAPPAPPAPPAAPAPRCPLSPPPSRSSPRGTCRPYRPSCGCPPPSPAAPRRPRTRSCLLVDAALPFPGAAKFGERRGGGCRGRGHRRGGGEAPRSVRAPPPSAAGEARGPSLKRWRWGRFVPGSVCEWGGAAG